MGTFTPNIGIYIAGPGETNYGDSSASGMLNIDQHDHSGGPNKGLPIGTSALGPFSVTYDKLNSNVVNPLTGIGVSMSMPNQLVLLGVLDNLFTLSSGAGVGFLAINGSSIQSLTLESSSSALSWSNPQGIAGNPSISFNIAGISPVGVANGGTGVETLSPYDIICGGTSTTGPVQQVSGEGNVGQNLTSMGSGELPVWANPSFAQASVTLTAAQFNSLSVTPIQIVPAPGAGKVLVPVSVFALLNFVAAFAGSGSVRLIYDVGTAIPIMGFPSSAFIGGTQSSYFWTNSFLSSGIPKTLAQNTALSLANGTATTGGAGSMITFVCSYYILTL
jgi:hypothetical protein